MTSIEIRDKMYQIVSEKEEMLKRVSFVLVPWNYKNRGDVFVKSVNEDLCMQFKIDISDIILDSNIIMLKDYLDLSHVTGDDIIDAAIYNTELRHPPKFDDFTPDPDFDFSLNILTNDTGVFGASVILYKNMYEKLSKYFKDFVIIPSSVHELIILDSYNFDISSLSEIIKEVNRTVVSKEEILGTRPYKLLPSGELVIA